MHPNAIHPNTQRVIAAGQGLGLAVSVRTFPEGTKTAADAAAAIGVEVGQIVKSLVFTIDDAPVIALVSGANQLDERRLAAEAGGAKCRRADADLVRSATGYPIGGVPPFGHAQPLRVYVDRDLLDYEEVWAAAGTWNDVFPIDPDALVRATEATVADLRRE
jgi:Cys-tRNA(Pro) deacylase